MMKTRNFRVRNDVVEISHQESKKGKKAYVQRFSVESTWTMFQRRLMQLQSWHPSLWKQGQRSETKRTIVFSCIPFEGKTDWRRGDTHPHRDQAINSKTPEKRVKFHADSNSVKIRHVNSDTLPCVWITCVKKDVHMAFNAMSDLLRQKESPTRIQRKVVRKDQLHCWRSLHNWVVYLKILIRENLFYVNMENWDQNTPSNSPKAPGTKLKFGKERVHREVLS